jgi:hypothetical protein
VVWTGGIDHEASPFDRLQFQNCNREILSPNAPPSLSVLRASRRNIAAQHKVVQQRNYTGAGMLLLNDHNQRIQQEAGKPAGCGFAAFGALQ